MATSFQQLHEPPILFYMPIPKPSLYIGEDKSNTLLIAINKDETEYHETKAAIYSFNIDTNEMKMMIETFNQHNMVKSLVKIIHCISLIISIAINLQFGSHSI